MNNPGKKTNTEEFAEAIGEATDSTENQDELDEDFEDQDVMDDPIYD